MTTLAERIAERINAIGISERAASLKATGSPNTIRNIRLGASRNPRIDTIRKIAGALDCSPNWLLYGQEDEEWVAAPPPPSEVLRADIIPPARSAMIRDIPVMGTVAGAMGTTGAFELTSKTVDYVARPPGLATATDIYALYVVGESMQPRFFPGDLVFVSPHKPVRVDDVIIIQEPNSNNGCPQAFIKIFRRKTEKSIFTRQLNPDSEVEFRRHQGTRIHKVLTTNELFGV